MTAFCIVGVDPGYRETGVIARRGADLVHHVIVERRSEGMPGAADLGLVLQAVSDARKAFARGGELAGSRPDVWLAVEAVDRPRAFINGKLQFTDPTHVLGTAMVLGAVLAIWPDAIVVAPAKHGRAGRLAYPDALWGPRESEAGSGRLRHCRAAYDIAGAAVLLIRERQQGRLAV